MGLWLFVNYIIAHAMKCAPLEYLKNRDNKFLASSKKKKKEKRKKKITLSAMHVGRMWCHCRMVYLPMSYLYGRIFVGPINSIILSLRRELYTQPYHQINWDQARNLCAKVWFFFFFFWKKENTWRIWYLLNLRSSNYSTIFFVTTLM